MKGRSLGSIIDGADVLAHLSAQAARLMRLQQVLEAGVPSALTQSCRVANLKSGKVVILAENGSVALKLKQLAQSLAYSFGAICPEVTEIEVRVQVGGVGMKSAIFRPREPALSAAASEGLSARTASELENLAGDLPKNSPLTGALRRLLASTRRRG